MALRLPSRMARRTIRRSASCLALRRARRSASPSSSGAAAAACCIKRSSSLPWTSFRGASFWSVRRSALLLRYGNGTDFVTEDIETYSGQSRLPKEEAVVFLMATYGDGEPTDSAADFYSWLMRAADDADNGDNGADTMLKVGTLMHSFI